MNDSQEIYEKESKKAAVERWIKINTNKGPLVNILKCTQDKKHVLDFRFSSVKSVCNQQFSIVKS